MEISNYITQITNKPDTDINRIKNYKGKLVIITSDKLYVHLFKLYFLSFCYRCWKNNYRYRFIVYRFVIAVKKKTINVIVLSFIAIAVHFLKKISFIVYRFRKPFLLFYRYRRSEN